MFFSTQHEQLMRTIEAETIRLNNSLHENLALLKLDMVGQDGLETFQKRMDSLENNFQELQHQNQSDFLSMEQEASGKNASFY
jgi:Holliday junction resolvasome RuvABC endonuclease subunit